MWNLTLILVQDVCWLLIQLRSRKTKTCIMLDLLSLNWRPVEIRLSLANVETRSLYRKWAFALLILCSHMICVKIIYFVS